MTTLLRPGRLALVTCLMLSTLTALAEDKSKAKTAAPKKIVLAGITMQGGIPETAGGSGLFGEMQTSLSDTIRRLDAAAKDTKVTGVVLDIQGPQLGWGKLNELRAAIARTRKSGKKVYAKLSAASTPQYMLASACDEIIMPPAGMLSVTGLRAEILFYKGLLDKLGLEADFLQVGKFKGAAEPMSRTGMSKPFRQQYEAVLDDMFDQMIQTIANDREIHPAKVRRLIDQGLFTAVAARKAGLIDQVAYDDEFYGKLKKEIKVDQIGLAKDYAKKKIDTDFSGFGGMMKMMELMLGGSPKRRSSRNKKIAVVYAVGVIMPGESSTDLFGSQTLGGNTIVKALRTAEKDKTVQAIVLRVNSPGGSALASDLIWREVVRIKKPVIASMGDVAASGGYYVSMGADKIFAEPGTLTGSIGVVSGKLAMGGLYEKLGLKTEVISRGKNSGIFSSTGKFTKDERAALGRFGRDMYKQFTSKACKGRKIDRKTMATLAQGRIWSGRMAAKNGLVDKTGTLADAIAEAKKLAGVKGDEKIDIRVLPEPKTFFDQLFGSNAKPGSPLVAEIGRQLRTLSPELSRHAADLHILRRLLAEPAIVLLPYRVDIK
jgi:protease-4